MAKFTITDSEHTKGGVPVVLGADPGKTGCVVVVSVGEGYALEEHRFNKYTHREWFDCMVDLTEKYNVYLALLEELTGGSPGKTNAAAERKLGVAYGVMYMTFICAKIRFETITPATWMRRISVQGKVHSPNGIRDKAQRLFPGANPNPTQQTGDAYLLAWLARERVLGI